MEVDVWAPKPNDGAAEEVVVLPNPNDGADVLAADAPNPIAGTDAVEVAAGLPKENPVDAWVADVPKPGEVQAQD